MSTPLTVGTLVQARFWCKDAEQASVNTNWWFVAAVGSPAATDDDLAAECDADGVIVYPPIINNFAEYRGVQVTIHGLAFPYASITAPVFSQIAISAGTGGTTALPRQTCGLASLQSPFPGPKHRGRVYSPFPPVAGDDGNGVPSAGFLADLATWVFVMAAGRLVSESGRTATLVRVLVHAKDKLGVADAPTIVTASTVGTKWATQRRRGSFGRANVSPI